MDRIVTVLCLHSSMDRVLLSEGSDVGSIPAGDTMSDIDIQLPYPRFVELFQFPRQAGREASRRLLP